MNFIPESSKTLSERLKPGALIVQLNKPAALIVLFLFSITIGYVSIKGGIVAGLLILVAMVALPVVYAIVAYPVFGVIVLMTMAYALFFILRFGVNFPLGTVLDGIQGLLILGFFIKQRAKPDWKVFKNPISTVILIWIGYNILEVANPWAESRLAWVYTVRSVAVITIMYFVFLYQLRSVSAIRLIFKVWLVLSFIGALYGFKQEFIGFSDREMAQMESDPLTVALLFINGVWRKYSIFSDPVAFSYNMVITALLCISLISGPVKQYKKIILAIMTVMMLMAMLYSGTRGAYVLVPAALILFALLNFSKRIMIFTGFAAFGIAVMIFMPTSSPTIYRFQSAFRPSEDASFNVRKQNQEKIKPYILSHPMGGGLGATGVWGVRFAPNSYLASFPPDSGYVRVAVEMGWIGLFLFCCLMFVILKTGIQNFYKIKNPELKSYCMAMTLIIFALNIGNYPQEALVQFPNNVLFYLCIALIQATYLIDQEEQKKFADANTQKVVFQENR
ncbi:O-antigen ligase like membrane protein [Dyadobacter koreensis]|uniref:O-antigen ligase like membrane protein n=1 Tax=Dyadobacter koreensis TaxID=408657 RepID=A0A1H6VCT9_9BACT|nr:O-antigen ligase family protein [Dyadobacter koreensis]SEI99627.1 O-antigen ligase like membrane protein [Dyadobacter koreensis]